MTYEVSIEVRHHPRHNDDDATVESTSFKLADYAPPMEMVANALRTFADELHPASATGEPQGSSPGSASEASRLLTERDAELADTQRQFENFKRNAGDALSEWSGRAEALEAEVTQLRAALLAMWQRYVLGRDAVDAVPLAEAALAGVVPPEQAPTEPAQ